MILLYLIASIVTFFLLRREFRMSQSRDLTIEFITIFVFTVIPIVGLPLYLIFKVGKMYSDYEFDRD